MAIFSNRLRRDVNGDVRIRLSVTFAATCARLSHLDATLLRITATLLRITATLLRASATLLRITATLLRIGATLVRVTATLLRVGATLLRVGATLRHGVMSMQNWDDRLRHGSSAGVRGFLDSVAARQLEAVIGRPAPRRTGE